MKIDPETKAQWVFERRLLNSYKQLLAQRISELDKIIAAFGVKP